MPDCPKCGAPLDEGLELCGRCADAASLEESQPRRKHNYDQVCGVCGALVPTGCESCLVCGAACGEVPFAGTFPVPRQDPPAQESPARDREKSARKTPDIWRHWGRGVALSILALAMVITGFGVYRRYFDTSGYRAGESILYEDLDQRLMLSHPGLESPKQVLGMRRHTYGYANGEFRASPNGRFIAYTDTFAGELYLIDLAPHGVTDNSAVEAVLLFSDVAQPAVFSRNSDYLVFITRDKELYASDLSECWLMDTNVVEMMGVDDRKVLYTRHVGENGGQLDLYLDFLPKDSGEWLLIDRGIQEVLDWTPGFEKLMYVGARQNEYGEDTPCLQMFELAANRTTTLLRGVGRVLDADVESETAIYLEENRLPWSYIAFVDDDMMLTDTRIQEPDLADYPLVEAAMRLYGAAGDFTDSGENEDLIEQNSLYRRALADWEDKQRRDELRRRLRALFATPNDRIVLNDLYVYANGSATLLDNGVWGEIDPADKAGHMNAAKGYIVYQKVDPGSFTRIKMSELWDSVGVDSLDIRRHYFNNTQRELLYTDLRAQPERLYIRSENSTFDQWLVTPGGDGVYFTIRPRLSGSLTALYYTPVRAGALGNAVLVANGVGDLAWPFRDGALFYTGEEEDSALCLAQGPALRELGEGLVAQPPEHGGNTLLYLEPLENGEQIQNLHMFIREPRLVAEHISGYQYVSDELIYYYREGENTTGIYRWHAGRESTVAPDARSIAGIPRL